MDMITSIIDLNTIWFLLVGILIVGYAILDGFDLGIGVLFYALANTDDEKKTLINAIGPVWDGNEVWLLTGGGALFAAFPLVYATTFSGFYLAMMLVLFGLIFRAVGVEYYFKLEGDKLQPLMGKMFFGGSLVPALLFGVAVGNVVSGIPLDSSQNYAGIPLFGLLTPFALLIGVVGLVAFLLQGSVYAAMKTEGAIMERAKGMGIKFCFVLLGLWVVGGVASYMMTPHLFTNFNNVAILYLLPVLTLGSLVAIPTLMKAEAFGKAFIASSTAMATMILTLAAGIFPNWVIATDPARNLTIYNASSSPYTLQVMLIITLIGMPLVLFYTGYVYYVFRGKASPRREGY